MEFKLDINIVNAEGSVNYLEQIKELSERNQEYLGVIPANVLENSYAKNDVFIATVDGQFVGCLLYRAVPKYRRYSIISLCIETHFRQEGIPNLLIDSLKNLCIESNYNGISLYCRSDNTGAIKVWEKSAFNRTNEKLNSGKGEAVSVVNWGWKNSMCRDLFTSVGKGSDVVAAVLDTNVLINLKSNDQDISHLLNDSLVGDVEYLVSQSSMDEINAHEDESLRTEMQSYVCQFQSLDFHRTSVKKYLNGLNTVFMDAEHEMRGIKPLAQTLAAGKNVFITDDPELLSKSQALYELYGVHVFYSHQLWSYLDGSAYLDEYQPARLSEVSIQLKRVGADEVQRICSTFSQAGENKKTLFSTLQSLVSDGEASEVLVVFADNSMLAVVGVTNFNEDESVIHVFRVLDSEIRFTLSYQLLNFVLKRQARLKTSKLWIDDTYCSLTEKITNAFGFNKIGDKRCKLLKQGQVNALDLPSYLNQVFTTADAPNLKLKHEVGKRTLLKCEKALWPLKIIDVGVPIYVIPITSHWAMQLFDEDIASEDIFASDPSLKFNVENVYFSTNKLEIKAPGRILWYVSSIGSKSPLSGHIRAISYLDDIDVGLPQSLFSKHKRFGTYDWENVLNVANSNLNKEICAMTFSRTELFNSPMALGDFGSVRESLGYAKPDLLSPLEIDIDTFKVVLEQSY